MAKKVMKSKGHKAARKHVPAEKASKKAKVEEEPEVEEEPLEVAGDESASGAEESAADDAAKAEEKAPKKRKTRAERLSKALDKDSDAEDGAKEKRPRGVMYVGHIPKGFFEPQMKTFFRQFGTVTRLRIARSNKSAESKGYGWVEFEESAVAKIAAQTMHKYTMFGKQLVCDYVPTDKVPPNLFTPENMRKKKDKRQQLRDKFRKAHNKMPKVHVDGETLPVKETQQLARRHRGDKKLQAFLAEQGVEYDVASALEGGEEIEIMAEPATEKQIVSRKGHMDRKVRKKLEAAEEEKIRALRKQRAAEWVAKQAAKAEAAGDAKPAAKAEAVGEGAADATAAVPKEAAEAEHKSEAGKKPETEKKGKAAKGKKTVSADADVKAAAPAAKKQRKSAA